MMNKRGNLIVFSGPSGVGKGTMLKNCLEALPNLKYSVSATTRQPREGEQHGREYYFISREEFQNMAENGGMLEYAEYNGNYYGTPKAYCEELLDRGIDVVLEIEVQGALQVKKLCPDALMIFVMPPSIEVLESRLCGRNTESAELVSGRMAIAREELKAAYNYDYVIVNDNLEQAVNELKAVIAASHCSVKSMKKFLDEVNK